MHMAQLVPVGQVSTIDNGAACTLGLRTPLATLSRNRYPELYRQVAGRTGPSEMKESTPTFSTAANDTDIQRLRDLALRHVMSHREAREPRRALRTVRPVFALVKLGMHIGRYVHRSGRIMGSLIGTCYLVPIHRVCCGVPCTAAQPGSNTRDSASSTTALHVDV